MAVNMTKVVNWVHLERESRLLLCQKHCALLVALSRQTPVAAGEAVDQLQYQDRQQLVFACARLKCPRSAASQVPHAPARDGWQPFVPVICCVTVPACLLETAEWFDRSHLS